MIKHGLEDINFEQPLNDKLPMLIEYFVKFYGEKYREKITSRLTNTTYVFADPAGKIDSYHYLKDYFSNKKDELATAFYKEIEVNLEPWMFPFFKFEEWQKELENFSKNSNITDPFLQDLLGSYLKISGKGSEERNKYISDYLSDNKNLLQIKKYISQCKNTYEKHFKSDYEYLSSEYERIVAPFKENFEISQEIRGKYDNLRYNLLKNHLVQHFGINSNDPELEVQLKTFERFFISKKYELDKQSSLSLFKFVTKSNSNKLSFEDFINQKELISELSPDELILRYKELETQEIDEILNSNPVYEKLKRAIKENNIYPSAILESFGEFVTRAGNIVAYVDHSYKQNTPLEPYAVCVLPSLFSLDNETLVHELNHIVATDILFNYDDEMTIKCGINTSILNKTFNIEYGSRENNILNEVINDYISLKINQMIVKDMKPIGLHKRVNSVFSHAFSLLEEFIEDNMEEICECLMSSSSEKFMEIFGRSEISELANSAFTLLLKDNKTEIIEEIESKTHKNVNIYDILDDDSLEFSQETKDYINCFRAASLALNKIKLKQLKEGKNRNMEKNPKSSFAKKQPMQRQIHKAEEDYHLN